MFYEPLLAWTPTHLQAGSSVQVHNLAKMHCVVFALCLIRMECNRGLSPSSSISHHLGLSSISLYLSLWSVIYLFSRSPRQNPQCYTNPKSLLWCIPLFRPRFFLWPGHQGCSLQCQHHELGIFCVYYAETEKQSPKGEFDLTSNVISPQLVMSIKTTNKGTSWLV